MGGGGRAEGICGSLSVEEPGGGCNAVDPSGKLALAEVAASLLRERKARPGTSSTLMRWEGDVQKKVAPAAGMMSATAAAAEGRK